MRLSWFLALQACSSGDPNESNGGPTVAVSEDDVAALCGALCEHEARCDTPDPEGTPCESACLGGTKPGWLRRDIVRGMGDCYRRLTCDESEDACLLRVIRALEPDYASSPLLRRCLDTQDQCGNFSDDLCDYAIVFTDAGKVRLEACLNSSCELVEGCIADLQQGT